MQIFPSLILHQAKSKAVKRFHPWIFSGAIKWVDKNVKEGDVVEVLDEKNNFLALGHYAKGSIAVRIFSFENENDLNELWRKKFESAFALRKNIGLTENNSTNAYRLINAEGDGMPGLIIDWYNGTAVIQCHSLGMNKEKQNFVEVLKIIYGNRLKVVFDKSSSSLHVGDENKVTDSYLLGNSSEKSILENNHAFFVDWQTGQKTGFFLDQRDNRELLSKYSKDKKILNTFCYSGGFSVYALKAGAELVHSVDSSAKAIEWTNENVKRNKCDETKHQSFNSDVFDFLKTADTDYDVVILDPPAFAKNISARHNAAKAYKRLNAESFKKIKSGGIIFTFSCSQAVNQELFTGAVTSAAIESGKKIKILHHLTQPADHPVSIYHPEGLYLKGLVIYVE